MAKKKMSKGFKKCLIATMRGKKFRTPKQAARAMRAAMKRCGKLAKKARQGARKAVRRIKVPRSFEVARGKLRQPGTWMYHPSMYGA